MKFDEPRVIEALNAEWRWIVPPVRAVMAVSSMGNVFLVDDHECYWWICPEELSAEIVARTAAELESVFTDPEAKADWQMSGIVDEMVDIYGELQIGECFGLMVPAVLGGEYSAQNIRRRCLYDYLRFTGDIARQTHDLKDGDKIKFQLA
jgi:hypothetical protein